MRILKFFFVTAILFAGFQSVWAAPIPFSFIKTSSPLLTDQLAFTTSSQNIAQGACSSALTIESEDVSNVAKVVGSDLSVNLSGPAGVTYYSDNYCSRLITSAVIGTGTSDVTVYFISVSSGAISLSASATNYNSAIQSETIGFNNYLWTGAAANGLWNTGANWSGGVVPSNTDIPVFHDSYCGAHCNVSIASNIDVQGVHMLPGYSGTITQGTGSTITVHSNGWAQLAGTFTGSNAFFWVSGPFFVGGGTFTSTSDNLRVEGDIEISIAATFNHNGGTVTAYCGDWATCVITPANAVFNNFIVDSSAQGENRMNPAVTTYMNVAGDLTISGGAYSFEYGTIGVAGNVIVTNFGKNGSFKIKLTGNPAGQTISASSGDMLGGLEIATGTNNVTLSGTVTVTRDYTVTSIGNLIHTGSTLYFACADWIDCYYTPGSVAYNNVTFDDTNHGQIFLNNSTMNISGDAVISSHAYGIYSGTLNVSGHLSLAGPSSGNFTVNLVGSASKTVTAGGATAAPISFLRVNKTGGAQVTLLTDLLMNQSGQGFALQAGAFDMSSHNMTIDQTITLNANTLTKNGGTLIVNATTVGTGALYGGTVAP